MTSNVGSEFAGDTEKVLLLLHKTFRPEFLNRIDQTILFQQITKKMMVEIVEKELTIVAKRLAEQSITLQFTDSLKKYLAESGYDKAYGARPLKRIIQDTVLDELALQIIEKRLSAGSRVTVDYKDGKVRFILPN